MSHTSSLGFLRNSGWNLAGLLVPVPIAIAVVPALIRGLGEVRFGLLTIAWAVMGYFTLFDLGLGRATTREIAAAISNGERDRLGRLIWSSISAHALLGLAGFAVFAALSAPLTSAFDLRAPMADEFRRSLLWLTISVPVLVVTAAFRGILEGFDRFDLVNIIRLPSSAWTYLAPWAVMLWTPELPAVVSVIVVGRILSLGAHVVACITIAPVVRRPAAPSLRALRPMIVLGWWLTLGTIVLPLMSSWDRFVIGAQVSPEAVGRYAAPYEVVTKLWVFSGALMGAAFPIFTAAWTSNRPRLGTLLRHGTAALLIAVIPAAMIIIASAPVLLPLWLGTGFGGESVPIARWLAMGVAASVVAQAGLTFLQASGRANWVARVQTIEVIAYGGLSWWAAGRWGATGVAFVWFVRAVVDCGILLLAADALARSAGSAAFSREQWFGLSMVPAASLSVVALASAARAPQLVQAAAVSIVSVLALGWAWWGLIDRDMRVVWRQSLRRGL